MADPTTELSSLPNPEIHHQHTDSGGGWLRPTVFGMMDELVSNFALIAGIAGANASRHQIALAGWAGLVGGAISMTPASTCRYRARTSPPMPSLRWSATS